MADFEDRPAGEGPMDGAHGTPFGYWLQAQGLPLDFPRLWPIALETGTHRASEGPNNRSSDDFFFFGQTHEELMESAIRSTLQPRVANIVPEGHGASTIARYVFDRCARIAAERCLIPVRVSLEDLLVVDTPSGGDSSGHRQRYAELLRSAQRAQLDGSHEALADEAFIEISQGSFYDAVSQRISHSIRESLLTEQWELATGRGFYAQLIGAQSASNEDLERRRRVLRGVWNSMRESGDVDLLERLALTVDASPVVTLEWQDLMETLFNNFQIRLSLQIDLSPSPIGRYFEEDREQYTFAYSNAISQASAALKDIEEESGNYLRLALFLAPAAKRIFENDVTKGLEETVFPHYSELDVFTILAVHFPRHTGSKKDRKDDLASVLDSRLLHYASRKGLSTMVEDLRTRLSGMTVDEMRYQLSEAYQGIFQPPQNYRDLVEWQKNQESWRETIEAWRNDVEGWRESTEGWRVGMSARLNRLDKEA